MPNRVVRLTPVSGATSTPDAGFAFNQINVQPINGLVDGSGLVIDRSENIYVADYAKHVIFKYRRGDTASQIFAGAYGVSGLADGQGSDARFNGPTAMAVDNSGNLYVIDSGNARIRRVDPNGRVFTIAAIPAAAIEEANGIAVDSSGNIYFVDTTA